MRPVLFRWRGVAFGAYPTFLYFGLNAGVLAGHAAAHASGLDPFRVFAATVLLLLPALFGARLLHVACNWSAYRASPQRIFRRSEGGAAQYGGLLLGVPLSVPLLALLDLSFGAFWDVGAITILAGMILTRVGCLLNGCCAGRPSDAWFSARLPDANGVWTRRIPTQCLEALWAAALLAAAAILWRVMPFEGALFAFVLGGYCSGRLVLESLRELPPGRPFTAQHAISLGMAAASLVILTVGWAVNERW